MSDRELESRLDFVGLAKSQRATLNASQPLVKASMAKGIARYSAALRTTPVLSAFFRDDEQKNRAAALVEAHWLRLTSGRFDEDFHSSVRRIGAIHARIGLEPRWYIGGYSLILEELMRALAQRLSPLRRLLTLFRGASATETNIAIVKAPLLDMEMSISVYFEQAEIERNKATEALALALGTLAAGDLASDLAGLPENFAAIETSYNAALANLRTLLGAVSESAKGLRTGSSEIAQAAEDLARRTEGNAASLEQTSAALAQMDMRLKATAAASIQTVRCADQAIETVGSGRATAGDAVTAMGRVSESAKGIDSVIEGLDKIAFQTRVLAMNAAVEAGRAGDAGRGFAVVADLVSALAMRAEEEAKRARDQLTVTQSEIAVAVDAVHKVDGTFAAISGDVGQVHTLLGSMADDARAQSTAITQISVAIGAMDQATQQNAAMVEQTSAAARNLTAEVSSLTEQAGTFKVGGNGRPTAAGRAANGRRSGGSVAALATALPV